MKTPLVRTVALALTALLFAACGKKEEPVAFTEPPAPEVAPADSGTEPPPVVKADAAETDAAFLKEMKPESTPTAPVDERAAYEAWFQKNNLDLNDPQMLAGDADGDGTSNRDEFLAGTNPRDPASKPIVVAAGGAAPLRFTEYNEVRLPLMLESVSGAQAVVTRNDGGENQTIRSGDTLRGFPLRVTKVAERQDRDKDGNAVDRSQVLLEDTSTKERVTLIKGLPAKTSATFAVLTSPDGKTTVKAHAGEVFAWPGEPPVSYRVVDLGRDQITLQEQGTRKLWTIPRR